MTAIETAPQVQQHRARLTLQTPQVAVIDDFLPGELFNALHTYALHADYRYVHSNGIAHKVWRIEDASVLRGADLYYATPGFDAKRRPVYPLHSLYDRFIDATRSAAAQLTALIGTEGKDWQYFSVTPFVYPKGSSLSMHSDGAGVYSGAYTFYMTPQWNLHWGGALLVLAPETRVEHPWLQGKSHSNAFYLDSTSEAQIDLYPSMGRFILPRPNRMVFIHPAAYHMVTPVTPQAGDRVRMSVAGFFHKQA